MHAMPWTVLDADTGPGFSFLIFFQAAGISKIKTLKKNTEISVIRF
jgi:hypothetical protein